MKHTISEIQKATSPNPFCLITSGNGEKTNIMALSWWTYASNHPATVAVCLSQKGYSSTLIHENGMFGLCLADTSIADAAFRCGCCSGRDVDKAKTFGIALRKADIIAPMLVEKSPVALECKVVQALNAGDHNLFIAEVVEAHLNPQLTNLYAYDGYGKLAAAR